MSNRKLKIQDINDLETLASKIQDTHKNGVAAIVQLGQLYLRAKEVVGHGNFQRFVESKTIYKINHAHNFMHIAQHEVLSNPQYFGKLPTKIGVLIILERIYPPLHLLKLMKKQKIHPSMSIKDAKQLLETKTCEQVAADIHKTLTLPKNLTAKDMREDLLRYQRNQWDLLKGRADDLRSLSTLYADLADLREQDDQAEKQDAKADIAASVAEVNSQPPIRDEDEEE